MKAALIATVAAVAAADALNPAPIVATAVLLGTPKPMRRTLVFLVSACATRIGIGAVVLFVFGRHIDRVIEALEGGRVRTSLQIGFGLLLVLGAMFWWSKPPRAEKPQREAKPTPTSVTRVMMFGVTATVVECATAIPYFGGIASIQRADVFVGVEFLLLVLFNVIYHLPAVALLVAWKLSGQRSIDAIERVKAGVRRVVANRRWAIVLFAVGVGVISWTATP